MKAARLLAACILILFFVSCAAWAVSAAKSGYMEKLITITEGGVSRTQTAKMYWEADKMRTEQLVGGQLMVNIKNGKTLYTYSPSEKRAMKSPINAPSVSEMFERQSADLKKSKDVKKVGAGSILGYKCDVYQRAMKAGKGTLTVKIWVSTDKRIPTVLKLVATAPGRTTTEETKKVKLNINVPDSQFTLPKGTTVKEVKPGQMPSGQPAPKPGANK